ncbi:amino acid ABC transporter permease [Rhodobacter capsulatus]|uniref:Polar amino acid ABC transporter, permease protein n=1 Tax=Rhodobacter capsulatus (strain ATCC BAA-309 / NBRC 16581 / SB1003) TaxID=272942 RepID=D5AVC4_RHOCB|nr:amino acid ABC transporter permease [Rhodobacter capsulatus]ADE87259.1 polar amino acid ABC transporter, permease protein [Rhodobacter capsulatus SB 1003]MDS0927623.1 amino acid ABC transporter permease [Rhodobacter capsulatus]
MDLIYEYRVFLIAGLIETLKMSLVVAIGGTLCAIAISAAVLAKTRILRQIGFALMEVLRDLPLMVTVLLVYFMLPMTGLNLDPFWSCCAAISIWGGANGAQILRAGLTSVSAGQRETAAAFGFSPLKGLLLITLPQAMPVIIPPYVSLLTALVQATSLGAVVGAQELLRSGQVVIEQTTILRGGSPAYLVYGSILVVYFALCTLISLIGGRIERHFLRPYAPGDDTRLEAQARDLGARLQTRA